jgi:SP family myo-inositol transporter-like MFS transporter 13
MTLEDIREIFNHGFGVKHARMLQREARLRSKATPEQV